MTDFCATHIVVDGEEEIEVQVVDNVCYQKGEWDWCTTADWELVDGVLCFQGQPRGELRRL